MGLTEDDGYEPTPREAVITSALSILRLAFGGDELDDGDAAAFIEGYLQGKELTGEL